MRFEIARKIVQRAEDHGIPRADLLVDPLVMPVGAINRAGASVLRLIRRLSEELKVNTTCGASNFSFGLPQRHGLNAAFLPMAIGAGMTSAITNPLHVPEMMAIKGANVVMGHDPNCRRWIKASRAWETAAAPASPAPANSAGTRSKQEAAADGPQISRRRLRKLRQAANA